MLSLLLFVLPVFSMAAVDDNIDNGLLVDR